MICERERCIFNTHGRCSCAPIMREAAIMDALVVAIGAAPGRAVGCSQCQEIAPDEGLDDCDGGECKL